MTTSSIAIVTALWGTYWKQFGTQFIDSMAVMEPFPSEVIIVTDQNIQIPNWIKLIRPRSNRKKWDWFNEAVEASYSEWVIVGSIDDTMLHDGLADIELKGNLIATACYQNGQLETCHSWQHWDNLLDLDQKAIFTSCVFRREIFLRFPWRRVDYADWMQWLELRKANVEITFDRKPRFIHLRHSESHTAIPSSVGDEQIQKMKELLVRGSVLPGPEWPPLTANRQTAKERHTLQTQAAIRRMSNPNSAVEQSHEIRKKLGLTSFGVPQPAIKPVKPNKSSKPLDIPEEIAKWLEQYEEAQELLSDKLSHLGE